MTVKNSVTDEISVLNGELSLSKEYLCRQSYASSNDIGLVSGTLVEGIGNRLSDIDIYVFKEVYPTSDVIDYTIHHRVISSDRSILNASSPKTSVLLIHSTAHNSLIKLDIEFKTFDDLAKLFSRIDDIYEYASKNLVLLTKSIDFRDQNLFHRIHSGKIFFEGSSSDFLLNHDRKSRYCYVSYRWFASDFSVLMDIIGALDARAFDNAVDAARENLMRQMRAYLHLLGNTNVRRKWLFTYMEMFPVPSDLKDAFFKHYYSKTLVSDNDKRDYVLSTLDVTDLIFSYSQVALEANPHFPSGPSALNALKQNFSPSVFGSTFAEIEFAYRAKVYGQGGTPTRDLLTSVAWG